jgi:hypothetical protein
MAIPKMQVYAVLRASPEPLTFAGIVALMHRQVGSRDSHHTFAQLEQQGIADALDELAQEGLITCKFIETAVYEVNE